MLNLVQRTEREIHRDCAKFQMKGMSALTWSRLKYTCWQCVSTLIKLKHWPHCFYVRNIVTSIFQSAKFFETGHFLKLPFKWQDTEQENVSFKVLIYRTPDVPTPDHPKAYFQNDAHYYNQSNDRLCWSHFSFALQYIFNAKLCRQMSESESK